MLNYQLTDDDLTYWKDNHHLVLRSPFSESQIETLRTWTHDLFELPETPGKWMKYFENSSKTGERLLCRVENFIPYHDGLRALLTDGDVMRILSELMGEQAVLFKEKINAKLPGGSGFTAHQDAPAFITFKQRYHITMMIAVDDSTLENGCLEFSDPVPVYETLRQDDGGSIHPEVEAELPWRPLEAKAGDIVFFDSYIPHRSHPNTSERSRRAMYITYNRLSEGSRRDDYFADKRLKFPPEVERVAGVDYSKSASIYNLANPIN